MLDRIFNEIVNQRSVVDFTVEATKKQESYVFDCLHGSDGSLRDSGNAVIVKRDATEGADKLLTVFKRLEGI